MEPQSDMPNMQPASWREAITLSAGVTPRGGQVRAWAHAMKVCEAPATVAIEAGYGMSMLFVAPTGYGKSKAAVGAYLCARSQGVADRVLILGANATQRKQWEHGIGDDFVWCGAKRPRVLRLTLDARDLIYAERGAHEVFVSSYQSLVSPTAKDEEIAFWRRLLSTGRFMVVFDECHHLAEDGKWGQAAAALGHSFGLFMSATPIRTDRKPVLGLRHKPIDGGAFELEPDVEVSYEEAFREEAIRWPEGRAYDYFVDVHSASDGSDRRLTTESLASDGVVDMDAYEIRYQIRYHHKYLAPILLHLFDEWSRRNESWPGQHQAIIFAMTCRHAEAIAKQMNMLASQQGVSAFADWIGVLRSEHDNERVLDSYMDNRLPCLVQVGKAGEGFDNKRASVGAFLNLVRSELLLVQQLGRLLRRNDALPYSRDTATVLYSKEHPVGEVVRGIEQLALPIVKEKRDRDGVEPGGEPTFPPFPGVHIMDVEFNRLDIVRPGAPADAAREAAARGAEILRGLGVPNVDAMDPAVLANVAERWGESRAADKRPKTEQEMIAYWRDQVESWTRKLARQVVIVLSRPGAFEQSKLRDAMRAINGEWVRVSRGLVHEKMTADDFKKKTEWIGEVYESIRKSERVPLWLCM